LAFNWQQEETVSATTKPFAIDKWLVYEAYQAVKANACGFRRSRATIPGRCRASIPAMPGHWVRRGEMHCH